MMSRHLFVTKLVCTLVSLIGVGGSFANAQLPPPGGGGEAPPKDNNPANPSNWEKVVSTTGMITAVSYPPPFVTPDVKTQNLAILDPAITDIQSWGVHSAYWDLPNGVRNFRLKWVGVGPAPSSVRALNKGTLTAHFSGIFDLTQSFTGLNNVFDASTSVDHILRGEDYKNVSVDTVYQIGFKMKGTVTDDGGSGHFSHDITSTMAELSTALRLTDGDTYHKLGDGPNREVNTGEDYSNWVADVVATANVGTDYFAAVPLTNMLSGPWNSPTFTYSAPGAGSYLDTPPESISSKVVKFPFTREQWRDLSTSPQEKTVNVVIKDTSLSDSPERTAKIRIRIHNPHENWRLARHSDGSPYETIRSEDPTELVYSEEAYRYTGDGRDLGFKYKHSAPTLTNLADSLTGNDLLNTLLEFAPKPWGTVLGKASSVTADMCRKADAWQTGSISNFNTSWDDSASEFHPFPAVEPATTPPAKDNSLTMKRRYVMKAAVKLDYKLNIWRCETYDASGYTGPGSGSTDFRVEGQDMHAVFTRSIGGGGQDDEGI
jgi:hypothetical protein